MMCIQTPGSFVFVYSLLVRPGVNWTAWGVYLVSKSRQPYLDMSYADISIQLVSYKDSYFVSASLGLSARSEYFQRLCTVSL